jgi:hypothetical protein
VLMVFVVLTCYRILMILFRREQDRDVFITGKCTLDCKIIRDLSYQGDEDVDDGLLACDAAWSTDTQCLPSVRRNIQLGDQELATARNA